MRVGRQPLTAVNIRGRALTISFAALYISTHDRRSCVTLSHLFRAIVLFSMPIVAQLVRDRTQHFVTLISRFCRHRIGLIIDTRIPLCRVCRNSQLGFRFRHYLSHLRRVRDRRCLGHRRLTNWGLPRVAGENQSLAPASLWSYSPALRRDFFPGAFYILT